MKRMTKGIPAKLALGLLVVAAAAAPSFAAELAAVPAQWTPPGGGTPIAMWGFIDLGALPTPTTAAGFDCLAVNPLDPWAVGPTLTAMAGDPLTVNLKNCLTEPVSFFIPGQLKETIPVKFADGQGRDRVRSFDAETLPDAVGVYTWNGGVVAGVKEGTYLYHSGTHAQVQVQMGLYGALVVTGTSYPTVAQDAVLVYSEIDPALHAAVDDGSYGTPAYPSTFDYMPRYFLINGAAYPDGADIAVTTGDVLLRFVNAGLKTHVPTLEGGLYMSLIAEDGNLYPFEMEQYGIELQAAKTIDAVVTVETAGRYALYDRALLGLTNWLETGGGMLTYLNAGAGAGLFELSSAAYGVGEADGTLMVTVNRVGGSAGAVSVDYATADGTATTAGLDYTGIPTTTLNFADAQTTATFDITILDDTDYEGDETFNVSLSNAAGGATLGTPVSAVVTIVENDTPPETAGSLQFSAATYSVAENGGMVTVTVDRVGGSLGAVTVDYATADGTATTAGLDYTGIPTTTLTFLDGVATSQSFDILILNDLDYEGDETFSVSLNNATGGATLGAPASAAVTIIEDETAPNVAPFANDDFETVTRNTTDNVINLTDNDVDADGTIAVETVAPTSATTSAGGTVIPNPALDGSVLYTPRRGFRGTELFTYTVMDNDGVTSNIATVRVNVVR